jgi:hypothetical protein
LGGIRNLGNKLAFSAPASPSPRGRDATSQPCQRLAQAHIHGSPKVRGVSLAVWCVGETRRANAKGPRLRTPVRSTGALHGGWRALAIRQLNQA